MASTNTALRFGPPALLGAFALFFLQPLMGKALTPRLGGGAGVWVTCMVFFQTVLLLGYLTAHAIALLPRRRQLPAWGALALATWALIFWGWALSGHPFLPAPAWTAAAAQAPILTLLGVLVRTVGAPFLLLATLSPLLQAWLAGEAPSGSPFRYYALSNLGSFLGLLAYPFLAEPLLSTPGQARMLVLLLGLVTLLALGAGASLPQESGLPEVAQDSSPDDPEIDQPRDPLATWLLASAAGSFLLVAASNAMSSALSIPMVWIAPLGAYLLTFVLVFDARWDFGRPWRLGGLVLVFSGCLLYGVLRKGGFDRSPVGAILCFTGAVTSGCLICHGLLHGLRPAPQRLTRFYLLMGLGGALGGWGGALVAPQLFTRLYELPIAAALVTLCSLLWIRQFPSGHTRWALAPSALLLLASATTLWVIAREPGFHFRDFFGTVTVRFEGQVKWLQHGSTLHGFQMVGHPEIPLSYYSEGSPLGQVMALQRLRKPSLRIGIVGLGVGSAAAYGRAGDDLRIYEISPTVIELAGRNGFAFEVVKQSPATVTTIQGDGRRSLEDELRTGSNRFDVLLVDAFSGDQVPWHLLTREALAVFTAHLAPDGILAFHVSNPLPINRVVAANIQVLDLWGLQLNKTSVEPEDPLKPWKWASDYVLVAKDQALAQPNLFRMASWAIVPAHPGLPIGPKTEEKVRLGREVARVPSWSDERNSLSPLLWMRRHH